MTKTLQEWADEEFITILDPDGFDRTDPNLMTRQFTHEEYMAGIFRCSVIGKPVDCKSAEKERSGKCLGYSPANDDEPIEACKGCSVCTCYKMDDE